MRLAKEALISHYESTIYAIYDFIQNLRHLVYTEKRANMQLNTDNKKEYMQSNIKKKKGPDISLPFTKVKLHV